MNTLDTEAEAFNELEMNILNGAMYQIVLLKSYAGLTNKIAYEDGESPEAAYHTLKAYEQLALVEKSGLSAGITARLKRLGDEANALIMQIGHGGAESLSLQSTTGYALSDAILKIRAVAGAGGRGNHSVGGEKFVDPVVALEVIYKLADAIHNFPEFLGDISNAKWINTPACQEIVKNGIRDLRGVLEKHFDNPQST